MNQCRRCEGFVPAGLESCPNCNATKRAWWKLPLTIAGAGVAAVTFSACYGPPCAASTLPDGTQTYEACGYDCRTALADGGTPTNDLTWRSICLPKDAGVESDAGPGDGGGSDAGNLDGGDGGH